MHFWGSLPDGQMAAVVEWLYDRRRARREEARENGFNADRDNPPRNNVHKIDQAKVKQGAD